jgi:hypothetical protein
VAKRNGGRRGRSRKRRPDLREPRQASGAPAAEAPAASPRARPAARAAQAKAARAGALSPDGERPQAPWHPWPLSELLILVGIVGAVIAWVRGIDRNAALLGAGIGAVAIGTIEVSLREHLSGFRSHTMMLSVVPAVVAHSVVLLVVFAVSASAPRWLSFALLPLDGAVVLVCFKLLRARYADARRERTFAGLR